MTDQLHDEDDVFEASSDEFAGKEDMLNRLVMIYPTGREGTERGASGKPFTWYDTMTVVLDDGPDGWQPMIAGKDGMRENLIPSVAENGPQVVQYRWSTTGAVTRLAKKLPKHNDGKPVGLLGRIDRGKATGGNTAPWRPNPPTEADRELAVSPEIKAFRLKVLAEIIESLKVAETEDEF